MILGGISQFFPLGFGSLIVGIYVIIFGLSTNLLRLHKIAMHANRFYSCGRP